MSISNTCRAFGKASSIPDGQCPLDPADMWAVTCARNLKLTTGVFHNPTSSRRSSRTSALSSTVLIGTSCGVYRMSVPTGEFKRVAMAGSYVNHVYHKYSKLLVACPSLDDLHELFGFTKYNQPSHKPGLHAFPVDDISSMKEDVDAEASFNWSRLWQGDARSCGMMINEYGTRRLFVGTASPADVVWHDDAPTAGDVWHGEGAFQQLPAREKWDDRMKLGDRTSSPYKPHVLSFELGADRDGGQVLVVGVMTGGCLVSRDLGSTWEERNTGLCPGVKSVRVDPFNSQRWYAVTDGGNGDIPGGLYITEDSGMTWRRIGAASLEDLDLIGLSVSAYNEGHLLVTAGESPPSFGTKIFIATNAGEDFTPIDEIVKEAGVRSVPEGVLDPAWRYTPVPLFTEQGALIGTCNGQVLFSSQYMDTQKPDWQCIAELGHMITALQAGGNRGSTSTVNH